MVEPVLSEVPQDFVPMPEDGSAEHRLNSEVLNFAGISRMRTNPSICCSFAMFALESSLPFFMKKEVWRIPVSNSGMKKEPPREQE